ncbi:hypothetical protein LZP73_01415 [Shewanella sp. AS16]|uniref:hypothetical protein n=1 Tax=Shewanella sp. AS16 TaxID=2907625 RepID=UPI001F42FB69|nr:hypothetical protein [Shewanella sp. AS16]MCE9684869.1 hypothetical protein [Shewanella sp. AS16]
MNQHFTRIILLTCGLLCGCSNTQDPGEYAGKLKDRLATDIKENGLKLFTYSARQVDAPTPDSGDAGARPLRAGGGMSPKDRQQAAAHQAQALADWAAQIELGLGKTLEMTGYCRQGYIELYRSIAYGRGEIHGECKEGADAGDRQKFTLQ